MPDADRRTSRSDEFDFQHLLQIVDVIRASSQFNEVRVRAGGLEIELRRGGAPGHAAPPPPAAAVDASAPRAVPAAAPAALPQAGAVAARAAASAPGRSAPPGARTIDSPMVGTFYRAPEPGAAPFVQIGQRVSRDTIVCIIEVMKLMTSLPAGVDGEIVDILVDDAQSVEAGQPLIVVRPA